MSDDKIIDLKTGKPRKPRRKETNYKPEEHPSAGPASGMPTMGDGWGGPPKGAGKPIKPGERLVARPIEVRQELEQEMLDRMVTIARTSPNDFAATNAADKVLDRLQGKPVQRTVTATLDDLARMTDEELDADLARNLRILGKTGA
jgi:hypothetical protein